MVYYTQPTHKTLGASFQIRNETRGEFERAKGFEYWCIIFTPFARQSKKKKNPSLFLMSCQSGEKNQARSNIIIIGRSTNITLLPIHNTHTHLLLLRYEY